MKKRETRYARLSLGQLPLIQVLRLHIDLSFMLNNATINHIMPAS